MYVGTNSPTTLYRAPLIPWEWFAVFVTTSFPDDDSAVKSDVFDGQARTMASQTTPAKFTAVSQPPDTENNRVVVRD